MRTRIHLAVAVALVRLAAAASKATARRTQRVIAVLFVVLFVSGCGTTYRGAGHDDAYNEIVPDSVLEAAGGLRPGQHIVVHLLTGEERSGIVVDSDYRRIVFVDSDYRRIVFGRHGYNRIMAKPLDLHLIAKIEVLDRTPDLPDRAPEYLEILQR